MGGLPHRFYIPIYAACPALAVSYSSSNNYTKCIDGVLIVSQKTGLYDEATWGTDPLTLRTSAQHYTVITMQIGNKLPSYR